jgi:hypothetical protein
VDASATRTDSGVLSREAGVPASNG